MTEFGKSPGTAALCRSNNSTSSRSWQNATAADTRFDPFLESISATTMICAKACSDDFAFGPRFIRGIRSRRSPCFEARLPTSMILMLLSSSGMIKALRCVIAFSKS